MMTPTTLSELTAKGVNAIPAYHCYDDGDGGQGHSDQIVVMKSIGLRLLLLLLSCGYYVTF